MTRRRRGPSWSGVAVAVVVMVVTAGCGGGGQTEAGRGPYTIYVHDDSLLPRGGSDALLGGTLVTRDGCVLLEQGDGAAYPVVWPSGTSIVDDDPFTLELRSGAQLTVGARVSGAGGSHPDYLRSVVEVDIADECRAATGEVRVFNPDEALDAEPTSQDQGA